MITNITLKTPKKYQCNYCNYTSDNKKDYSRHLSTDKHIMISNDNVNDNKLPINKQNICDCGNEYKYASGLSRHKKKCNSNYDVVNINEANTNTNNSPTTDIEKELLIKMLLKNQDVMDKMIEMMPNMGMNNNTNSNITNNTNSHNTTNNQFNIQMFLNDHCKNAMNLTDFIQSLPITSETYDSTIENGLTKTITSMMVNGLNELDILERPIHCTDASRKTLYVKDSDKWEKDNELLYILKGIKELSLKQRTLISKWREVNEGWQTDENLQSKMTNLVFNSMTQIESDEKETGKIIRSISKKVYLDNETKQSYI